MPNANHIPMVRIGVWDGSARVRVGSAKVFGYQLIGMSKRKYSFLGSYQRKETKRMGSHSGGI